MDFAQIPSPQKQQLLEKIQGQIPAPLRPRFRQYAPQTIVMAIKYQVDPLWAIAIMWVESHFDITATSSAGARGAMQIMPATGRYLARQLARANYGPSRQGEYQEYLRPHINIEMGVFYLAYLVKKFDHHRYNRYELATMAYNMGHGRLNSLLAKWGPSIKQRNHYLKKVHRAYFKLLKPLRANSYGKTASSTPDHQPQNPPTLL